MEQLTTDILIIGSGLAGLLAALEAERRGLHIIIVGKFAIGMGTNTSLSNGAFTASNAFFSKEEHLRATIDSGKGLSQVEKVNTLIEQGPEAILKLKNYGVPIHEKGMGYVVERAKGSDQLPGILLIRPLIERIKDTPIQLLPGLVIFDLLVEEGQARGAFGFFKDGRPCLIQAKAVLLTTGGAGAIFQRNDNQKGILGDGYALALRAGISLLDLEFVQFYPFALGEPRLSSFLLYPPYPEELRLFDEKGQDLLDGLNLPKDINQAIMDQRDRLSIALYQATQKGDVFFDFTQVPPERWNHFPLNFLKKSKFPFLNRPFLVGPVVHFFMGGVETDKDTFTSLPGLFAAGEVAWGIHGANRLGGNALTECAVFGIRGGLSAADYVLQRGGASHPFSEKLLRKWEKQSRTYFRKNRGTFDPPADLMRELRDLAWRYAGPIRDEELLKEGLEQLASIERRVERVYPNTLKDLFRKRDLENASLLLKAILKGSLARKESRGSFYRRDFSSQDDTQWLKHSCYRLEEGEIRIFHRSVSNGMISLPN